MPRRVFVISLLNIRSAAPDRNQALEGVPESTAGYWVLRNRRGGKNNFLEFVSSGREAVVSGVSMIYVRMKAVVVFGDHLYTFPHVTFANVREYMYTL